MERHVKPPIPSTEAPPLLREPLPAEIQAWLNTPFEQHLARWKQEIAEGLRSTTGLWIGDPALRRRLSSTSKENKK